MNLTPQEKRYIQKVMTDPMWVGMEAYFQQFMEDNFTQQSIRRGTEFDTIWAAAEHEGAKRMLNEFWSGLDEQARLA